MLFVDRNSRPRSGDRAYLHDSGLRCKQKRAARAMHAAYDEAKATHREPSLLYAYRMECRN